MKLSVKNIFTTALFTTVSFTAFGWGQKGHDTVAYIAECHLTPAAKSVVDSLLDGKSLVYWANWLDNASHTPQYEYSITWHYKNVDENKTFDNMPLCETGDVVSALNQQQAILADTTLSKEQRALALKMVTHLYGDLHQPMHLGRKSDRGGNRHYVKFFKSASNLHSVWDSRLPEAAHKWSYSEWQREIDRATPEEMEIILAPGTPEAYARETYEIAKRVYDSTPADYNIEY
ncbi:MAG: S1/P1 nuclease, partial [Muribaculaceae bacterium]|nr:S1/P1 nuclease [Muribaculaceae bacterium]